MKKSNSTTAFLAAIAKKKNNIPLIIHLVKTSYNDEYKIIIKMKDRRTVELLINGEFIYRNNFFDNSKRLKIHAKTINLIHLTQDLSCMLCSEDQQTRALSRPLIINYFKSL